MHIISGNKKGRKIVTPRRDFRPTQSKVREAFFNIVNIENKTFLDLCSGSGAMGFEALSRGANSITLIDIDREAVKTIFANAKNIFPNDKNLYTIKRISADDYVKKIDNKFDIIYFDPPYHSNIYFDVIKFVIERKLINEMGILAAEFGSDYYKKFLEDEDFNNIISDSAEYEIKCYGESILIIFKLLIQ